VEQALTTAWFEDESRLTPDKLQNVTFPATRLGRRGYEEEPVNQFMCQVHGEFVRLVNERASLWQDVQQLRRRMLGAEPGDVDDKAARLDEGDDRAARTGEAAARVQVVQILREAQERSSFILEDAHEKARDAAVTALNSTLPAQTDSERRATKAELAYLRTYSRVYRQHLRAYTEGVLRGIEDWERKEAASLQEAISLKKAALGYSERRGIGQ
jgi:cell division septum initiation protein DivIVA